MIEGNHIPVWIYKLRGPSFPRMCCRRRNDCRIEFFLQPPMFPIHVSDLELEDDRATAKIKCCNPAVFMLRRIVDRKGESAQMNKAVYFIAVCISLKTSSVSIQNPENLFSITISAVCQNTAIYERRFPPAMDQASTSRRVQRNSLHSSTEQSAGLCFMQPSQR